MGKLILFIILVVVVLVVGFFILGSTDNRKSPEEVEAELCVNSARYGAELELMRVEKCELKGETFYRKEENTNTVTDIGGTKVYDSQGEQLCEQMWFSTVQPCEQKLELQSCYWERVCGTGGW